MEPLGGGHSGTESIPTANQPCSAQAVKVKDVRAEKGVVNFQNRNLIGVVTCNKDVFVCTLYHCKIHYIHYRIAVYGFVLIKYDFRGRWSVQSQKTGVVPR